jgi:hypothetical protein
VVEDQRIAVGIAEVRLVADAAVHRLAFELDAAGLELLAGGLDILHVQRNRSRTGRNLPAELRHVDELDRQAPGLELAAEIAVVPLGALEPENAAVELLRLLEARDRQEDEIRARDQGRIVRADRSSVVCRVVKNP